MGHERALWTGLLLVVVVIQWPVLKGFYYRAAHIPAPPTSIHWRTDLGAALLEAHRSDKRVLVDFSASWCPPCIAMKHDVWPDPAVERALAGSYVPVLIDIDHDTAVPDRYGITGIPTIVVLDATGRELRRGAFLTAAGMMRFLAQAE